MESRGLRRFSQGEKTSIVVASKRMGHKLTISRDVKLRDRRVLGGSDAADNKS